jgi:tRNA(fMet)-specific endonuclease VapC
MRVIDNLKMYPKNRVKVPSMVKAELIAGALISDNQKANLRNTEKTLSFFQIVPFDDAAAEMYGKIKARLEKSGNMIGPNDLIIAATVLSRGGTLVTSNTKEFSRVEGLDLVDWFV